MDELRFSNACQLRDAGKSSEAYSEFSELAESAADPLDKACALLYAADTLQISGDYETARAKLDAARVLMEDPSRSKSLPDEKLAALQLFLDFEDANLFWLQGDDPESALRRFDTALKKYGPSQTDPRASDFRESIQTRRAFLLADLGRWREALPILERIRSPKEYVEGVAFYLGHCYLAADDYERAEEKLTQALKIGLPKNLEYRAHCELGITYYNLKDYRMAKQELEKGATEADPNYIKQSNIWKWLEITCRRLGLNMEADHYANMMRPS